MGRRRQAREIALQALYLADSSSMSPSEAYLTVRDPDVDEKSEAFCRGLIEGTAGELTTIDARIQEIAQNWDLVRMASVDRCLLRLAAFELIRCPETPVSVVIDEALEIAKKYSSEESSKFINGILGKLKELRPSKST